MRAMWRVHGKPAGAHPGLVAKPYTLRDARDRLAEISNRAFADSFFDRFVEGREVPDYEQLLAPAGVIVRKRNPGAGWSGVAIDPGGKVTAPQGLVAWGAPAFEAGLEHGDAIVSVNGKPYSADAVKGWRPGDKATLEVRRVDGRIAQLSMTLGEDPSLVAVAAESANHTLTPGQKAFREAWLGSQRK
jgi:predicted metalloprotease with PDZ domain